MSVTCKVCKRKCPHPATDDLDTQTVRDWLVESIEGCDNEGLGHIDQSQTDKCGASSLRVRLGGQSFLVTVVKEPA